LPFSCLTALLPFACGGHVLRYAPLQAKSRALADRKIAALKPVVCLWVLRVLTCLTLQKDEIARIRYNGMNYARIASVLGLSAKSCCQRSGLGGVQGSSQIQGLQDNGYAQTSLSAQKDNPAIRLYRRLGYQIIEEKTDHAGNKGLIMVKDLVVKQK
jgi:ribosomal protein S18 acetylase RimI-like enzyme